MRIHWPTPLALICQAISITGIITTTGLLKQIFFATYWVATLATLIIILGKKVWDNKDWLLFGTFSAATTIGVLISIRALQDIIGLGVSLIGLFFVTTIITAQPSTTKRRVQLPNMYYSIPNSKKYHTRKCSMIKGKQDLEGFFTQEEARKARKTPCKQCI